MPHARAPLPTRLFAALAALAVAGAAAPTPAVARRLAPPPDEAPARRYADVVADVAGMTDAGEARALVEARGLSLVNVLWEDTGRWEGSAVGPNISDVTIEVDAAPGERYLMPVMRHDNFTDRTGDVRLDRLYLPVGNEDGRALETITLEQFLRRPGRYLSLPKRGSIAGGSLLAERDSHALVSAQHAFLPVPASGRATFHPVIFNYQSFPGSPAVLTLLVTRQGTSATIIDNQRDAVDGSWGQRLFFNDDGRKAPLIAERLADVRRAGRTANGEDAASLGEDANLLMIVQVPLKQREAERAVADAALDVASGIASGAGGAPPAPSSASRDRSDVDVAVVGHGEATGPFVELDGLRIERDDRFPVRVTVQFYQATSSATLSADDVARMTAQLDAVYAKADYVGSLVVPAPADRKRPTRWRGASAAPATTAPVDLLGLARWFQRFGWG